MFSSKVIPLDEGHEQVISLHEEPLSVQLQQRRPHIDADILAKWESEPDPVKRELMMAKEQRERDLAPPQPLWWTTTVYVGVTALGVIDFLGEKICNFFGLTQSKYQYILDLQRWKEEEEQQRLQERAAAHALHAESIEGAGVGEAPQAQQPQQTQPTEPSAAARALRKYVLDDDDDGES
eukprot:TRINITY_DN576_c0_g1_i1.p1 TRINITY_DN576_c0_g1~~TRINITY_DN576_c0_g1_i1.p1  ORF type:complete len:180 (-),score=55.07 TRINITY_DN576_c0_g1_i1:28-567(-)